MTLRRGRPQSTGKLYGRAPRDLRDRLLGQRHDQRPGVW